MVAAHHLIWTGYGCWLPNDPRGGTSHAIRCDLIAELGALHYGRKVIQPTRQELRAFYDQARAVLQHTPLTLAEDQIPVVGAAFADVVARRRYTVYACAVLPDHAHVVVRKHRDSAETMIAELQRASRHALRAAGEFAEGHPIWGGPGWRVFLHTRGDIERVIRYVEQNPAKARREEQHWPFVTKYDGWLPGVKLAKRPRGAAGQDSTEGRS